MYDWANSAFALTIVSAIFPIYYENVTRNPNGSDLVSFFGFEIVNTVLFSYAISCTFLLMMFLSPILSALADFSGRKKIFMQLFCYLGATGCALLFWFTEGRVELGILAFCLGLVGFSGSIMFYNSFLPEIATEDQMDKLSAKGFSLGYVGSVILLVLNLVLIMMPDKLGITTGMATRISFLSVGIWWAGWAQIPFRALPKYSHKRLGNPEDHLFQAGFKELYKTWKEAMMNMQMKRFLPAFFFFNMGIQTIMLVAPLFGEKLLKIPSSGLIATILLLQVLAILGAFLTSRLSGKMGNKITLILLLMCWVTICICAYFTETHNEFYVLAGGVGLIMGGSQSLSRSTFAKYIPEDSPDTASYFSFYDVTEKASVVIGTFSYGIVEQLTGTMRNSVLALIVFFVFGLAIISTLKSKAKKEATFQ